MIGLLALMLQVAPAAPVILSNEIPDRSIQLNCDVRAPAGSKDYKLKATILAEENKNYSSNSRSRVIDIVAGLPEILGKHEYPWYAPGGGHHIVISDAVRNDEFVIDFTLPPSPYNDPAAVIIYRSYRDFHGVVGVGYCTHIQNWS